MATKIKTIFYCQSCGYESSKWMGQCPGCKEWNTFVEETVKPAAKTKGAVSSSARMISGALEAPKSLSEIEINDEERADTHIGELNRVLGGGLVRGSMILVGGDPGIGKSTLLLQVAGNLSGDKKNILYISGEESLKQIKLRANRIGEFSDTLKFMCETNLSVIEDTITSVKPEIIIIDSIQTMFNEAISSAPGSVSQVRESTAVLLRIAKSLNITVFIVGHVTKEGQVAGPRVLEHMVDTVLYFEGDRHASYRILRAVKNRFGSTNEIGVFEMAERGLIEVKNPSEFMLEGRPENSSGSIVTCSVEGTRPILIELQALVCRSNFGFPRRQANGTDYNRVNLLMAVLEKRIGLQLGDYDAYINLAGGMKIAEPSLDLGICMAIISSFKNKPISDDMIAFGEVGLSGEVRAVNMAEQRVSEAKKLGFKTCIVPKALCAKIKKSHPDINIIGVASVADAMNYI
ncbi:DNA repair protein RadA [Butyrivibrio sp. INlla21]|uniref:DNA repair protein RadA n=1 Tax=Butyrivibrio sp. INlla21 TaxID=1520811 RepID=UPI0008F10399|nr:DNA repair protein RadA [Butyrivibrio sp. INlla21]SFU35180.1 DNA repair protein RadA/Sms [Butyrivibrio sp. INlla21]